MISCVVWKNGVRRWEYLEMDETCKFYQIFFFAVDVTTLGSMHKSWSSSMCNAAHGPSYLDADICPRILFLRHVPYVWPSHGSLVRDKWPKCCYHFLIVKRVFPELGHTVNRTQEKGKTYINNKTVCSAYSCHSLKWGSNV